MSSHTGSIHSSMAPKKLGIDRVLENKIDWGKYQKRALIYLCLIDLNDGVELILMTIILPILKIQFELIQSYQVQLVSSVFYFGMFIGAYFSGVLADKYGRRPTILFSQLFQGLIAIYFSMIDQLYELYLLRTLYGIVYGFSLPLSTTLFSEITPLAYRGKGIVIINSAVGVGKLYGAFMAYLILQDIHTGNWQVLVLISSVPCFIVFYGVLRYVHESPRYLLVTQQYEKLTEVVNGMIEVNKRDGGDVVDEKDLSEFRLQNDLLFSDEQKASTKQLFERYNKFITIRIWIMWFFYHTMSKGQLLILPFIVGKTEKNLSSIVYTILGEIPAIIFAYYAVDETKYFGRKKTIIIFFFVSILGNLLLFQNIAFGFIMALTRFCYREVSSMLYTYTTEVYSTNNRVLGIGWATGMGRLGTCLMSFYLIPLIDIDPYMPFLAFTIFSCICCWCAYTLPVDTTGKLLDVVMREYNQQQDQKGKLVNMELLREPSDIHLSLSSINKQDNQQINLTKEQSNNLQDS